MACSVRCTYSKTDVCTCSCEGKNHGHGMVGEKMREFDKEFPPGTMLLNYNVNSIPRETPRISRKCEFLRGQIRAFVAYQDVEYEVPISEVTRL